MAGKTQLDRIEGAIFGNGREGLIAVTARIEENIAEAKSLAEVATETNRLTAAALAETTEKTAQALSVTAKETADALAKLHAHYNERFDRLDECNDTFKAVLAELSTSITAHEKTEHLADIIKVNPGLVVVTDAMKKPRFFLNVATFGALLFIFLHLVSTYIPNVWDWAMLLLGLPKFVIPTG